MRIQWYIELPQWLILAAMAAIAVTAWNRVPLPIPVHWSGHLVDGFGGKFRGLLMWPAIALALYLVLFLAGRYSGSTAGAPDGPGGEPNSSALRPIMSGLFNLARIAALAMIAIIYFAQVRFAEGHFFDMERINRYGLYTMAGITGLLIVSMVFLARPRQFS